MVGVLVLKPFPPPAILVFHPRSYANAPLKSPSRVPESPSSKKNAHLAAGRNQSPAPLSFSSVALTAILRCPESAHAKTEELDILDDATLEANISHSSGDMSEERSTSADSAQAAQRDQAQRMAAVVAQGETYFGVDREARTSFPDQMEHDGIEIRGFNSRFLVAQV
ncbi:hypothetical protein CPAR01_12298 [Colletotrichum paranaense]|uniref:Uncharacterized protein n=1 Tax=Colletotrichum paranaense TaxID=1914294 RepID=A0ABQ9S9K4_9PEZI|nr:uncharacterized protein CPAR01_12298 [Colletotrichum paranaense]KAK1529986.1 hypothetical protein CPAR01_12298 [Colletotrichum paranaense]